MTTTEIDSKVIELSADQVGVPKEQVSRESHYINDLNYDSLDVVELSMELEDEFEVSLADDDMERVKTVGDASDLVAEKKEKSQ